MSTTVTQCLECNAPLSPAETQGLCARCLLKMGLASQFGESSVADAGTRKFVPPPMFPFDFGGYRVLQLLGRGGMGAVYEAEDIASGRRVALKVLGHSLDSPDTRKRFLREGRLAASINHPNSVYVYGTEEVDGTPVITMELVPGGTLHERVKEGGPLPVGEAVDVILQVIAGLEAAHTAGILHRDIKPSNCFVEPGGTVKVGDFGLSISTLARGDSALTVAGSILGTPDFSSPEQLRGEALDVRADIYSVGVTLYFLLTGRTPFQAENMVALLATVLEKPAPSPRNFRPEIPEALARVILRCLAKPAGDRFSSYDELRRALLPFTSTAPTPATLGLRFIAGVVDQLVFTAVAMIAPIFLFGGTDVLLKGETMRTPGWIEFCLGMLLFEIAYFALGEGRWGATPGKALVGLRVGGLDRNAPGIPRALLRALIYLVPTMLSFGRFLTAAGSPEALKWNFIASLALWLWPGLLCLTARRRNGYATAIDLFTKTRVIQRSAYEARETIAQVEQPIADSENLPQVGPYHVLATLGADGEAELLLGYDTKLMRRVWIRQSATAADTAEFRHVSRPGRLRWLQGQRNGTAWDAYEAAPGTPLISLLHTAQPWKNVRHWLLDLTEEFAAAQRDGSMPAALSLDRVWITASGGAKLLDFRAPGTQATEPIPEAATFLNQLAISALEGRVASPEEARTNPPRVPVALHARDFLRGLREATDFPALAAALKALIQQRPAISRRRRLGLVVGCTLPALLIGGMGLLGMHVSAAWRKQHPDVMRLKMALINHQGMEKGMTVAPGLEPAASIQPLEIYIAGRYRNVLEPEVWNSQYATTLLTGAERERAGKIFARHREQTAADFANARAALGKAIDANGELDLAPRMAPQEEIVRIMMWPMALIGFVWAAILSVAAALLCRGGLLMRALSIAVVRSDGTDASRLRMFWRACLAWSWIPVAAVLLALLLPVSLSAAIAVTALLLLGVVLWSAARPQRSLQDRLAGTWLVPR